MLVPSEWLPLEEVLALGLSPAVAQAYAAIGFVEVLEMPEGHYIRRQDLFRMVRAERLRRDLGVNLMGAALVVELLEGRYGRLPRG